MLELLVFAAENVSLLSFYLQNVKDWIQDQSEEAASHSSFCIRKWNIKTERIIRDTFDLLFVSCLAAGNKNCRNFHLQISNIILLSILRQFVTEDGTVTIKHKINGLVYFSFQEEIVVEKIVQYIFSPTFY